MKRTLAVIVIFIFFMALPVFSLELEIIGGIGNLAYDRNRTSSLGGTDGAFSPQLFPLALLRLSGEHDGLAFNAGLERDPIMHTRLFANVMVDMEYIIIEAGPTIGLLNSFELLLNPGVSGSLKFQIPGKIFVQASGSSSLAFIRMEKTGNYSQYGGDAGLGFWVPYVICSLNTGISNFTVRERGNLLIEDELSRYFFRADVFTKNVPYDIRVDLGYQSLRRSYISHKIENNRIANDVQTDEFKSVFLGLEGIFTVNPSLRILLGLEMPIYYWGVRPLQEPPKSTVFLEARAGVIWTLPF